MTVLPTIHCNWVSCSSCTIPTANDCFEVEMCMVFLTLSKQILTSVITSFPNESRTFAPIGYSVFCDIQFAQVVCLCVCVCVCFNRVQMCCSTLAQHRFFLQRKATRCTVSQIYLIKYSTCFGHVHFSSTGVSEHCIHVIGICHSTSVGVC